MAFDSDDELDADMLRAIEESRMLYELSQLAHSPKATTSTSSVPGLPNQYGASNPDYDFPELDLDEDEQLSLAKALSVAELSVEHQKNEGQSSSNIPAVKQSLLSAHMTRIPHPARVSTETTPLEDLPGFDVRAGRTWIYPTNYPLRLYQRQIVETALFYNTLVSLPTGLGKTFIAAVVMYNFYRWYPQGKVVFMAPTKPLVAQQIEACFNIMGIPLEVTAKMTGMSKPEERRNLWQSKRVFFLTPQILSNDLKTGLCQPYAIKCLVIDEAHRALGKHAYCEVVTELKRAGGSFRILALSATPGSDMNAIKKILENLLISKIELRTESSPEMQAYSHERDIQKIVVPFGSEISRLKERFADIIRYFGRRLVQYKVLLGQDVGSMTMFTIRNCKEIFTKTPTVGMNKTTEGLMHVDFALCMTLAHGMELLQKHGFRSLYKYITKVLNGTEGYAVRSAREFNNYEPFRLFVEELRSKLEPGNGRALVMGHPKLERLESIVLEHFKSCETEQRNTRVMIFSQYRESVEEITAVLQNHAPLIKAMSFLGQSKGTTQKQQIEVVKNFKKGGYNTLVCTCVGEEGLDIGEVDLIVCYDASKSPITLVQRMGRTGRKRKGRVVVLVTQGKEENAYNQSVYQQRSLCKSILQGDKLKQFLYAGNPRMIPEGLEPVCHEMPMTVGTFHDATDKPDSKGAANVKGKQRKLSFASGKKTFLTHEEQADYEAHFELNEPFQPLMLDKFLPWQDDLQPIHKIDHSSSAVAFVEALKLISSLRNQHEDVYGMEMAAFLNAADTQPEANLEPGPSHLKNVSPVPEVIVEEPEVQIISDPVLASSTSPAGLQKPSIEPPLRDPKFLALFETPTKGTNTGSYEPRTPPWRCLTDINASHLESLLVKRKSSEMERSVMSPTLDFKCPSPFGGKFSSRKRLCSTPISVSKSRGKTLVGERISEQEKHNALLQSPIAIPDLSPMQPRTPKAQDKENSPGANQTTESLYSVTHIINVVNVSKTGLKAPLGCASSHVAMDVSIDNVDDDITVNFDLGIDFLWSPPNHAEDHKSSSPKSPLVELPSAPVQPEASVATVEPPLQNVDVAESSQDSPIFAKRRNQLAIASQSPEIRAKKVVVSESDAESPLFVRKRKLPVAVTPSEERSEERNGRKREVPNQIGPKRRKSNTKARRFLDMEANVSSDVVVSSDESADGENAYDASFVDDATQRDHSEVQHLYRRSIKSPPQRMKFAQRPMRADIFSQVASQDDDYEQDSFCVDGSTEEEFSTERQLSLTVENTPPKARRIIRPVLDSSSEESEASPLRNTNKGNERTVTNSETMQSKPRLPVEKEVEVQNRLESHGLQVRAMSPRPKLITNEPPEDKFLRLPVLSQLSREERLRKQKEQQEANRRKLSLLGNANRLSLSKAEGQESSVLQTNVVGGMMSSSTPTSSDTKPFTMPAKIRTETEPTVVAVTNGVHLKPSSSLVRSTSVASTSAPRENTKVVVNNVPTTGQVGNPASSVVTLSQISGPKIEPLQGNSNPMAGTLAVLIDSKQVQMGGDIISHLRNTYKMAPSVCSLSSADYILSPRMGVLRRLYSEFSNGGYRAKLLDQCRQLMVLFDRPCLLIETDRIKEEKQVRGSAPAPVALAKPHTKYVDMMFAALAQTHIKVLYSSSQEESAELLFLLTLQECQKGFSVPSEVKNTKLVPFLVTVPDVTYVTAMVMSNTFLTLRELCNTPAEVLAKRTKIPLERARRIQDYIRKAA